MRNKLKALFLSAVLALSASNAAVTMNESGQISGNFDMAAVNSVAGIIFTALASLVVLKWAIGFIRRA